MPLTIDEKVYITERMLESDPARGMSADHFRRTIGVKSSPGKHKLAIEIEKAMGGLSEDDAERIMATNPYLNVSPDKLVLGNAIRDNSATAKMLMDKSRKKNKRVTMANSVDARVDRKDIMEEMGNTTEDIYDEEYYKGDLLPTLSKTKKGGLQKEKPVKVKKTRRKSEWNMFVEKLAKWESLAGFRSEKMTVIAALYKKATNEGIEAIMGLETATPSEVISAIRG